MSLSTGVVTVANLTARKNYLGELGVAVHTVARPLASTPNFRGANQAYAAS